MKCVSKTEGGFSLLEGQGQYSYISEPTKLIKLGSLLQEVCISSVFYWLLTFEFARVECLSKLVSDFSKITFAQIYEDF